MKTICCLLLFLNCLLFYYTMARAVTLRLLQELDQAKGKKMTLEEIQLKYNLKYMIRRRLKSLSDNGLIFSKENRFFLTPKGFWLATFFLKGSLFFGKRKV